MNADTHRDRTRTDAARTRTIQRRCARHAKRGTTPTRSGRYATQADA